MLRKIYNYPPVFISQVSSDFVCGAEEKKISLYDQNAKSDVEACSECAVSDFLQTYYLFLKKAEIKH